MFRRILETRYAPPAAAAVVFAAISLLIVVYGCDRDTSVEPEPRLKPAGALVSRTDCKESKYLAAPGATAAGQDCLEYEFVGGDTLLLTHVNAAFNCCPGEIAADIRIQNDTITIVERESAPACHCLCLYDLEYRIEDLPAGTYTIQFVEPYTTEADKPLRATIDLSISPSGESCVERAAYPWNLGSGTEPYGILISHSGCGSGENTALMEKPGVPGDMSCVDWTYWALGNVLVLDHINAAFNCCPGAITVDISVQNDTITIVEREEQSMCDCNCLYTLHFEIRNLEPRSYTIRFVEPYVQPGDERLEFTADLANPADLPRGIACAYRPHYPWGSRSTIEEDRAELDAMREEILALIGAPSCSGNGECRYIGLGAKPCGGVWEYLIYSTAGIDTAHLEHLVRRYNAFNDGFNRRYNISSDCMFVLPPRVGCIGGTCAVLGVVPR